MQKQKMTRLRALTGLGSLITAAGCAGSPAVRSLLPGASRGAAPSSTPFDPSQYFRVTKRKVAPLNLPRYRKSQSARTTSSTTSYDPLSGTTVVSDGAGNSVWYDSEGGALMTIVMSQLSDGSGVAITMTANDGTQRSSYIPTASAFDGSTTTTVGALTMSADSSSGQYVGNYQTDSGVVTIASTQSVAGDYTTTLPDGSTFTVQQAAVANAGFIPSSHGRHPQDISNPACVAAIAALVAAIIGLCILFWYAVPIVASLASQVAAAAATTGAVQIIGGSGIYGAICAAVIAAGAGAIALINTQCAPASPITLSPSTVTLQQYQSTAITVTQTNYYAQSFTATAIGPSGPWIVPPYEGNILTVNASGTPGTFQFAIGDRSGSSSQQAVLTVIVLAPSPSPSPTPSPTPTPASPSPTPTAPPTMPPASPSAMPATPPPTMPPASPSAMPATPPPTMPPSPRPSGM